METVSNKRILSGVQPSGILHIGNYFGAIRQHIRLQEKNECYYFVANFHSLNSVQDPERLTQMSLDVALDYLALGLDPQRSVLFLQSDVPEVCELAWILSTLTPMGLLERSHAYKDKLQKGLPANHGLFAYPTLMAADILIYDSDYVPVGKDQKQHLEMTRDMAEKFNLAFGETLKLPEDLILDSVAVVPGIDGQKMSKSYNNTIEMFASKKEIKSKVMKIVTDSAALEDPKDPDQSFIVDLYKLFATPEELRIMQDNFRAGGYGYGHAKKELLEKVMTYFGPARERREALVQNMDYVREVLHDGALRARERAAVVMDRVRKSAGIMRTV
ncbi:MAG TPA: tryptophan--tRNA ligase [Calditrichia bacterium]|nr:tryptophan--tRNA ligase [Calditrichia bacterium]HQV31188.1 tryptophan--tRNA ligase [Calditrichia bacterium]